MEVVERPDHHCCDNLVSLIGLDVGVKFRLFLVSVRELDCHTHEPILLQMNI